MKCGTTIDGHSRRAVTHNRSFAVVSNGQISTAFTSVTDTVYHVQLVKIKMAIPSGCAVDITPVCRSCKQGSWYFGKRVQCQSIDKDSTVLKRSQSAFGMESLITRYDMDYLHR